MGETTAVRQGCAAAHTRPTTEPPMQQVARRAMERRTNTTRPDTGGDTGR
jgi:hypothetical protein